VAFLQELEKKIIRMKPAFELVKPMQLPRRKAI